MPLLVPAHHAGGQEMPIGGMLPVSSASLTLGKPPVTLDDRVRAMKFTADGKELLTVTDKIDRIAWPTKERRIVWQPHDGEAMDLATFSPDGSRFARLNDGNKVHVHDSATGKLLHTFQDREPRLTAIAWSADGGRLAAGAGNDVVIHELKTGTAVRRIRCGDSYAKWLAWSPDGRWLAVATGEPDKNGSSIFLQALGDASAARISLPGKKTTCISFAPDSKSLVVACEEDPTPKRAFLNLYFWDLAAGKEIHRQQGRWYNGIVHSPDGRFVAACGLNSLEIFDAKSGRELCRHRADSINNHIWSAAFSPDGKVLATGIEDRVRFRETATWNEIEPDEVLRAPVSALAFSGDGRHLVTGGCNGDLVLWDWTNKMPVWKRLAPEEAWDIKALSVDPAAHWIGVVQHPMPPGGHLLRLVDFATGETKRMMDVPELTHAAPLFHPSRPTVYLATRQHELVEWDCERGQVLRRIPIPFLRDLNGGGIGVIDSTSFDPGSPETIGWTAETQAYGRIHLPTGVESYTFEVGRVRPDADPMLSRDPDLVAIGPNLWNRPPFHVRHPSGLLRFTASGRSVRVFDILSQSFIHTFEFGPGTIQAIALSPDGRTLVAATTGGVRHVAIGNTFVQEGTPPDALWQLMGGANPWNAYLAAWALADQPDYLRFLESQLAPAREPAPEEIARLKALLSDSDHEVRQSAARQWLDLGHELARETYETLGEGCLPEKWPSGIPQFHSGIGEPRGPIPPLTPLSPHRRAMRAVMILREDKGAPARRHLERLAAGHPLAPLTIVAKNALASIP